MKHIKKIFAVLMVLVLCGTVAACSSQTADAKDDPAPTETAAEEKKDEETSETEAETEETAAVETANVGIIASSMGRDVTNVFVEAVQITLSEQYPDQVGEVIAVDAQGNKAMLLEFLNYYKARWDSGNNVILLVNDAENGFSDEDILTLLEDAEGSGFIMGVDHSIDGAPESTFVYDASDPAGCASLIMENALK